MDFFKKSFIINEFLRNPHFRKLDGQGQGSPEKNLLTFSNEYAISVMSEVEKIWGAIINWWAYSALPSWNMVN